MAKKPINLALLIILAGLVPITIVFAVIIIYGVNVPFHDQWALVSLFEKDMLNGQLSYRDFWRPHNEHITPFSLFIQFHLAKLTAWNSKYEMLACLALAICTYGLIGYLFHNSINSVMRSHDYASKFKVTRASLVTLAVFIAFAFFSINQWENWIWGWQVQWHVHTLGVLLTFASLSWAHKQSHLLRSIAFISAVFGAVLATFSLASGILVWLVAIPMFFIAKHLYIYLIPWLCCFGISVFVSQSLTGGQNDKLSQLLTQLDFLAFIKFLLAFLASAIRPYQPVGIILLALSIVAVIASILLYKKSLKVVMPWILLGIYIVAAGITISIGRSHYGFMGGGSPRYATLSNIAFISLMILLFLILIRLRYKQLLINSILVLGFLSIAWSSNHAGLWVTIRHSQMLNARHCLDNHAIADDACLQKLFPHVGLLKNWIFVLEHLGYSNLEPPANTLTNDQNQQLTRVKQNVITEGAAKKSGVYHLDRNSLSKKDLNAYGTWVNSDANVGRIDWKLDTDKALTSYEAIVFEYTTGPSIENLQIHVLDEAYTPVYKFPLTEARSWTQANINIDDLDWDGTGSLSLSVVDDGSGWGQWIAVLQPSVY